MPQLKDDSTKRDRPAITCHNHDNNGVRSEKWRYIRYADGSEELYDMIKDPNEWTNLAGSAEYRAIMEKHRKWIPKNNQKPAPGSKHRVLTYDAEDGSVIWEGNPIKRNEPIPEI